MSKQDFTCNTKKDLIVRAPRNKEHPYMMLLRSIPQDLRMTAEERGVLIYIFSKSNTWSVSPIELQRSQCIGEKKWLRFVNKYKSLGYMKVEQVRNEKGKFSHNLFIVSEEAISDDEDTDGQKVTHGSEPTFPRRNPLTINVNRAAIPAGRQKPPRRSCRTDLLVTYLI